LLPEEERALALSIRSAARRTGFTAGRLALHAALAESDARAHAARPILRDERGRPKPTWDGAPPLSIAHSRARAVAVVAPVGSCTTLGVDVEEIDHHRAQALLRMSLSEAEIALIRASDPELLTGPIALWCAREACVKAHAIEVGWFGSALRVRSLVPVEPRMPGAEASFEVEVEFESRPAMRAHAWQANGAMFALAVRR